MRAAIPVHTSINAFGCDVTRWNLTGIAAFLLIKKQKTIINISNLYHLFVMI
jgi:hypothetical protein